MQDGQFPILSLSIQSSPLKSQTKNTTKEMAITCYWSLAEYKPVANSSITVFFMSIWFIIVGQIKTLQHIDTLEEVSCNHHPSKVGFMSFITQDLPIWKTTLEQ